MVSVVDHGYEPFSDVMVSVVDHGYEPFSDVMVSVVDHGYEPWSVQTKVCNIGIYYFSTMHAALRNKS
jgi:hypothetical protein